MKKEKKVENLQIVPEDFIDVTKFAYSEDVNIEISGQLFFSLMKIMAGLANDEVKHMYKINPISLSATAKEENIVEVISNEGVTYFHMLGEMETIHLQNIKDGKTITVEELQAKIQEKIMMLLVGMTKKDGDDITDALLEISEYDSAKVNLDHFRKNINRLVMDSTSTNAEDMETGRILFSDTWRSGILIRSLTCIHSLFCSAPAPGRRRGKAFPSRKR